MNWCTTIERKVQSGNYQKKSTGPASVQSNTLVGSERWEGDNSNSYDKNPNLPLPCQRTGAQIHILPFCKTILMLISHFPCALAAVALLTDGKPGPSTEMGRSLTSDGENGSQVVITAPCSMIYRSLPHATHNPSLSDQTDAGAWGPQQNHLVQTWGPGEICIQNRYPCPKSTRVKQKEKRMEPIQFIYIFLNV